MNYTLRQEHISGHKSRLSLAICVCLWLIYPVFSAQAGEHLAVDLNQVIQKNFLGINAVYHAFTYMPESIEQGMNDEFRKIEFQRVESAGLHIARTFYRPDWAMGDEAWSTPNWQSRKMQALYRWLTEMQKLNIDVALNMGWWFGRDVIWNRDQHLASYPDDMHHYAQWVSESLHQIIQLRGFDNVKYIIMFTEPAGKFGDLPGGRKTWNYYKKVLQEVQNRLVADGRRTMVKIIGPNTTQAPRWVKQSVNELNGIIDIYDSHNYNFRTYQQWLNMASKIKKAVKPSGKPFWLDEYGLQDSKLRQDPLYGNILALANVAFLNAGAQTSLLWIFNDQYYPYPLKYITNGDAFVDGLHKWGLFPWLPDSRKVRPAWFAFTMMSRLMGGGDGVEVYESNGTKNLHIAATGQNGKTLNMMVVNESPNGQDFDISIKGHIKSPLYHYIYDPARIKNRQIPPVLNPTRVQSSNHKKIKDHIPPKGIIIYSHVKLPRHFWDNFKLINDPHGNLAKGKTALSSSTMKDYPPANVIDGKRLFYWSSAIKSQNTPESITIDLEKEYQISEVDIYPRSDKKNKTGVGFPQEYTLSISRDGKTWQQTTKGQTPQRVDATVKKIKFPPRKARYIRLTGQNLYQLPNKKYVMQIAEIKVLAE